MGKRSGSVSVKKEEKKYKSDRVYWNEKIPTVQGILKFDNRDKGLKKNDILNVQCDDLAGYSLFVRCRLSDFFFVLRITDFYFTDDTPLRMIKEYRKKLIEKKLIEQIKDFDY